MLVNSAARDFNSKEFCVFALQLLLSRLEIVSVKQSSSQHSAVNSKMLFNLLFRKKINRDHVVRNGQMSKGSSILFHKVGTFDMVDCYEFSFE